MTGWKAAAASIAAVALLVWMTVLAVAYPDPIGAPPAPAAASTLTISPSPLFGRAERACTVLTAGGVTVDTPGVGALLIDVETSTHARLRASAAEANAAMLDYIATPDARPLAEARLLATTLECEAAS